MPRNKRNRVVSLSKVKPKGSTAKEKLMNSIREAITEYRHAIVFSISNARSTQLKDLRQTLPDTRFFMGKNRIMNLALGQDEESEARDGLHLVSKHITRGAGLLLTNHDAEEIINTLQAFEAPNFARSGFAATSQFELPEGILEDQPFSMETQLRKLGLPTKLDNGKVYLEQDTVVCKKGQILTPEQCKILELFGVEMAVMRIHVKAHLDMEAGEFQEYQELDISGEAEDDENNDNDEDDEMGDE